jgi:hypothetical protein
MPSLREQIRNNLVALVSLTVAVTALVYATWRNEQTEENRNLRAAGFELLTEIGSLQQVVFYAHYGEGDARGDPRMGWADVLTITDLAAMMPPEVAGHAANLRERWGEDWSGLGHDGEAHRRIDESIDRLRQSTLAALGRLD